MYSVISNWYTKHFSDPQVVILAIFLAFTLFVVLILGDFLTPVLLALLLAYLLDGVVTAMQAINIPRPLGSAIVLIFFFVAFLVTVLGLLPLLWQQTYELVSAFPAMVNSGREQLLKLPESYPNLVSEGQIIELINVIRLGLASFGQNILSFSAANVVNIFAFVLYIVLVPMMVYFALKDKREILAWVSQFAPERRALLETIWQEVDMKIASYIRGKFIEILIIWLVSYITFALMGLNFSLLLSFFVGISVIIPFVGAVAVTIPVAAVAFFQWGFDAQFGYLMLVYLIIQILDGNLLVPLLFSEIVNLHPIAIIVPVLFFGGLWGVWGVFFAIPLATLVQAILHVLSQRTDHQGVDVSSDEAQSV